MSARKSLTFSFLDRYASLIINIVSSMVLARMLTPGDIGVFSVTMVLLALVSTVRDMGAGQYVSQERDLTTDRLRAVWAVQLGVGLLLSLIVLAASVPVASFYGEPRMREIMWVIALNYAINPFGSITYTLLMRDMRYDTVAIIRFTATVVSAVMSGVLAWRGFGPLSLAWGSLAGTTAGAVMSIQFRPRSCPWLPGWAEVPRVMSFGTKMTATSIVETVVRGAAEFSLGKLQGFAAAGLYSRANGLVTMFDRLVTDAAYPVALSVFSKDVRSNLRIDRLFEKSIYYVTALAWPFAIALFFLAHPVVRVLYGDQWDEAVDLTRLLCIALALNVTIPLSHAALVASGAASKTLRASLGSAATTLCFAGVGAYHGLPAIGGAMAISGLISACIWLVAVHGEIRFSWRRLIGAVLPNLWLAAAAAAAPIAVCLLWGIRPADALPSLMVGGLGAAAALLVAIRLTRHALSQELDRMASTLAGRWLRRSARTPR